jgi:cyclophilin family peptidyl-prolyl cis-trans isomerase
MEANRRKSGSKTATVNDSEDAMKAIVACSAIVLAGLLCSTAFSQQGQPGATVVVMTTNMGVIEIELFSDKAPATVANFLSYVMESYYDSTIFHRVMKGFMIQGGGFAADFARKPTKPPIKNEAANDLRNKRGTIAMARTGEIHSATSQFFINLVDNGSLDHKNDTPRGFGYCVFGKVVRGLDVVDRIAEVNVRQGTISEAVPTVPVVIESVRVKE